MENKSAEVSKCSVCEQLVMGDDFVKPGTNSRVIRVYYCKMCGVLIHKNCVKKGIFGEKCPQCGKRLDFTEKIWCITDAERPKETEKIIAYWYAAFTALKALECGTSEASYFIIGNLLQNFTYFPEIIAKHFPELFEPVPAHYVSSFDGPAFKPKPQIEFRTCPVCGGTGSRLVGGMMNGHPVGGQIDCWRCYGKGKLILFFK